jgi:hypothetical protein
MIADLIPPGHSDGLRAELLQREVDDLRAANAEMRLALLTVLNEVTAGHRPYSMDSYLPEHLVSVVRRALATGGRP